MRDEEQSFAYESAARDRVSRMLARLEKQRMAPRRTLDENLALIATMRTGNKVLEPFFPWPAGRKQGRTFKINQAWPNCWSYSS